MARLFEEQKLARAQKFLRMMKDDDRSTATEQYLHAPESQNMIV
jgi:hypothetical protein